MAEVVNAVFAGVCLFLLLLGLVGIRAQRRSEEALAKRLVEIFDEVQSRRRDD